MVCKVKKVTGIFLSFVLIFTLTAPLYVNADSHRYISAYLYEVDNVDSLYCYMKDDVPVPYVAIDDYLDRVYTVDFSSEKQGDGIYRISNSNGYMIVDTHNDTIHFNAIEEFLYYDERKNPLDTSNTIYERIVNSGYNGYVNALDMNLGEYNIDIIEVDDRPLLPLTTISDIAGVTYCSAIYYGDDLSFNYAFQEPFVNWGENLNSLSRDIDEVNYTYNEICFVMDNIYGLPTRCMLSSDIADKGFDNTLSSYDSDTREVRNYLNSTDAATFVYGLVILSYMMNDGGHTSFEDIVGQKDTPVMEEFYRILEDDDDPRTKLLYKWNDINSDAKALQRHIVNYLDGYDQYESMKVFDKESANGANRYRYYEYDDTGIFVYTNYDEHVVEYFKQALDIAKVHGMKNFVLDESYNGGGVVESCMYMINALIGEKNYYYKGSKTGNLLVDYFEYDMDLDGQFEGEAEDFDYDFNYGVICSRSSFSCGNLLPCVVQEAGIPIIGETSGGGAVTVGLFKMAPGNSYNISAFRTCATKGDLDVDSGATPDYDLTKTGDDGMIDYSDFHNFALIDSILDKHYLSNNILSQTVNDGRSGTTLKVKNVPKTNDVFDFLGFLGNATGTDLLARQMMATCRRVTV